MATYKNGILGPCSGKVGDLVFYILNGKQVVRTKGKITKPPTEKQLLNRMEVSVVHAFLKPIVELINAGFASVAKGTVKSPYNMAFAYNKKNAVQGVYPNPEMDYEKVMVTQGRMQGACVPAVELTATGLSFTWSCSANMPWPRPHDQVMLLAYFPVLKKAVYLLGGANRASGAAVLALQPEMLSEYMEVYISFVAQDRKGVSNSTYLGSFNK